MAVKIRLTRTGSRNAACFRVVAADSRFPRDGRYLEILGWYDPKMTGVNFKLRTDRIDFWRSQGAEISDTVASLLKQGRRAAAGGGGVVETPRAAAAEADVAVVSGEPEPTVESAPEAVAETEPEKAAEEDAAQ